MENLFIGFGTLLLGFGLYIKYEKTLDHSSKITPKVAKEKIANGAKVLDVRTSTEYNISHYKGAVNLTYDQLSDTNLTNNGISKTDTIVVYCNSGTRARKASDKLVDLGYKNVFYIVETYLSLK